MNGTNELQWKIAPVPIEGSARWQSRRILLPVVGLLCMWLGTLPVTSQEPEMSIPERLVDAALERTSHQVVYDGAYRSIEYPGGDVPDSVGVCTDVVIRSYRAVGIDLQELVHRDMVANFGEYPPHWGLTRADANIDHRRVPNLQTFFRRHGVALPASQDASDYLPGDLVTWMLPGNLPHIGIVVEDRSTDGRRPMIVHNIGRGPRMEDTLFRFSITGHYRYPLPEEPSR